MNRGLIVALVAAVVLVVVLAFLLGRSSSHPQGLTDGGSARIAAVDAGAAGAGPHVDDAGTRVDGAGTRVDGAGTRVDGAGSVAPRRADSSVAPGKDASDARKLAWLRVACPKAPCFTDVKLFDERRKRSRTPADEGAFHTAVEACRVACLR